VDRLGGGHGALDGMQETEEILVPLALHAVAKHGTSRTLSAANSAVVPWPLSSCACGIGRILVGADAVSLEVVRGPDPLHEAQEHPGWLGHRRGRSNASPRRAVRCRSW
jgi:hypothetical protein